ncbi:unnamed protein product [Blepharisma stoltei]|uniref:Phosphodiesterase n=1 Tax=Blepharisma stoltei TaxID=1481888 RepID=A0AAU9JCA9_9CILI|nr:unnamed protein product [Blepharisma stoltei]
MNISQTTIYRYFSVWIFIFNFDLFSHAKAIILLSLAYFNIKFAENLITYSLIYFTTPNPSIFEIGLILSTFLFPLEEIEPKALTFKLILWFLLKTTCNRNIIELSILIIIVSVYSLYQNSSHHAKSELHTKLEELQVELAASKEREQNKPNLSMRVRRIIKKLKLMQETNGTKSVSSQDSVEYTQERKDTDPDIKFLSHDRINNTEGNEPLDTRFWLSSEEIKDIIYNLVTTETALWPQSRPKEEPDVANVSLEAKRRYTQAVAYTGQNSEAIFKAQRASIKPPSLGSTRVSFGVMRSTVEENEDLGGHLEKIGMWDFDTLGLLELTDKPAFEVGFYVFETLGLTEEFHIDSHKLLSFLTDVERSYNATNYYHNALHSADVTASTVFLIREGVGRCGNLLSIDVFSLIVAALCHDIGHPGFNNAFLVAKDDKLALKYNDQSVLENMHSCSTFKILRSDDCNIIDRLSRADYLRFRKVVIMSILATDLQRHYDVLNEFKTSVKAHTKYEDEKFRILALQATLKCADIGHGSKKLDLHKIWSGLITKEFFRQGDTERQKGMTVTPLCDRNNIVVSRSQMGFLNFLAKPLFECYEEFVVSNNEEQDKDDLEIKICTKNIFNNLAYWEEEAQRYDEGRPEYLLDDSPPPLLKKKLQNA